MKSEDRKAAKAAYKERKSVAGIFAVRCVPSGEVWVGQAPNVDTVQNRLWFSLRTGTEPYRSLQEAWKKRGSDCFTFEVLERLEDDELAHLRDVLLKEQVEYWRVKLGAASI